MRVGILNAYCFPNSEAEPRGSYYQLMKDFVTQAFPESSCDVYDIGFGQWPKKMDECDVWIITGSAKGAYDSDPWILQLKDFIILSHQQQQKMIGICFGHQIIAQALGGQVQKSQKGWGLGINQFEIHKHQSWMTPQQNQISLLFTHQDQVIKAPKEATIIAGNDFCPVQMFQVGNHILTVQGHPEYTISYCREKIEKIKQYFSTEDYQKAIQTLFGQADQHIVSEWFHRFASR